MNLARPATQRRSRSLSLPIQTQRLSLREFAKEDLDALCGLVCDRRVTRYMFYMPGGSM